MVVVPFDPDGDLILVDARIGGPRGTFTFRFALDTGCAETLVVPEALDEVGYSARDAQAITSVTTALGRESGYRLQVAQFQALGTNVRSFTLNAHDLPEECGIRGLLGLNFLRNLNYEIRSKEGRIFVQPA